MKKIVLYICVLFILLSNQVVVYWYQEWIDTTIDWNKVKIIKVIPDLRHKIITSVSIDWDNIDTLVNRVGWVSWITWSYFCPADYWKSCNRTNSTTSDRIFEWKSYSKYWPDTWWRWMFGFTVTGAFLYIQNNLWYANDSYVRKYNEDKIDQVYYWLSNHPVLLIDWEDVLSKEEDNLLDKKMLKRWPKNFICVTQDQKTYYMWQIYDITMYEIPHYIHKNFDCWYALNLDSWPSSWIIYNNQTKLKNKRLIMDAFVVYENPDYKEIKDWEIKQVHSFMEKLVTNLKSEMWLINYLVKIENLKKTLNKKIYKFEEPKIRAILSEMVNFLNQLD